MKKLIALVLAMLCLAGCTPVSSQPDLSENEYGLWFASEDRNAEKHSEVMAFEPRAWAELPGAQTLVEELLDGPKDPTMVSPFPKGVQVLEVRQDTATATISVNLSEQYGTLAGFDLTVADYCIVMTLCQIPWIDHVRILVEGEPILYRSRQNMQQADLLLTGIGDRPEKTMTVLFFPDRDNLGLNVEYRQVGRSSGSAVETVMTELLRGPMRNDAVRALPKGTQILGLSVNGPVCQVDLSSEFVTNAPQEGIGPTTTLYALVNTLCALGGVSQVRVLVEGSVLQSYHGVAISNPISANLDYVND